jgi:hypothetical protein
MVFCDKNHSVLIKSSSEYSLIYSSVCLVQLISCFTTGSIELSLNPRWTRASATLINMQFLYVLGGSVFGGKEKYQKGRTCLQDCKFLYLLNIC